MTENRIMFNVTAYNAGEGPADYNKLRDELKDNGYRVEGAKLTNGDTMMYIFNIEPDEFAQIADEVGVENVEEYVSGNIVNIENDDTELEDAFECVGEVDECGDADCETEDCDKDVKECNEDEALFDEDFSTDFDDEGVFDDDLEFADDEEIDYPDYESFESYEDMVGGEDVYDEDSVNTLDDEEFLNINDEFDLIESCNVIKKIKKSLNEKAAVKRAFNKKHANNRVKSYIKEKYIKNHCKNLLLEKKKGCCGNGGGKSERLINLSEALKAMDPKQQSKLDKTVQSIADIVKDVKGQSIGEYEAQAAFKKLKAEHNNIKKIEKKDGEKFKVTDVTGVSAVIKKIIEADPTHAEQIKKWRDGLTESVAEAILKNKKSLHESVTVSGKAFADFSNKEIAELARETKALKEKYTELLKTAEIGSQLSEKLKAGIAQKNKLMVLLKEEMSYRSILKKLNEDAEEKEEKKDDDLGTPDISDDDLAKMFGSSDETEDEKKDGETSDEDTETSEDEDTEEVEITRVVIDMVSKEDAEELKQYCVDAGIPEDAIEIDVEGESSEDEEDAEGDEDTESEGDGETESEGDEANESIAYREIMRLFEDEETEGEGDDDEAEDAESEGEEAEDGDEEAESEETEEGAVKFILTDTDYIEELSTVLNDTYGISKEEFEEMIGGEIVGSDDEDSEDDEPLVDETEEKKDEENKSEEEDDISASDIFGNM